MIKRFPNKHISKLHCTILLDLTNQVAIWYNDTRFQYVVGRWSSNAVLKNQAYWIVIGSIHWRHPESLHTQSLTWNLRMMVSKRNLLFQGLIFRFHIKLQGCQGFSFKLYVSPGDSQVTHQPRIWVCNVLTLKGRLWYPPANQHILFPRYVWVDDFPFPKVGYVNFLEGSSLGLSLTKHT